ncbi:MAG: type II/IV secretion system protein, partial [Proteobacteria bacterium]|nr:type II/IV secretion system protein [Pseudomonadota bacterium]
YRIDGILHDLMLPPKEWHAAIISRVKVIGRMDIAEKRIPQEGRIHIVVEGREVDLRLSSMPTILGEKIVMRVLDKSNLQLNLDKLGYSLQMVKALKRMLAKPYGLFLVTGPTGSGKTTTLYSGLDLLRNKERNIVTIEDPVEYQLEQINQIQVHEAVGLTFARTLRSVLRQDPDIIMVGEIRDQETAEMAIQAALTGHLVLSTLHTNDAPSAIARLSEIGVPPYLISATLIGVVAQRLVRTLCPHCKQSQSIDKRKWKALIKPWTTAAPAEIARAEGCLECRQTGFIGRVGIYEMMPISETLKQEIGSDFELAQFRKTAIKQGMRPLNLAGAQKVAKGMTTIEEVLKVAPPRYDG